MLGAVLTYKGRDKNIIKTLLSGIETKNLHFNLVYWESYGKCNSDYDFNSEVKVNSEIIKKELFKDKTEIYPEFIELFIGYEQNYFFEPVFYKDFIESNYILSLVIIDRIHIEICCKEENILKKILENFGNTNLENKKIDILENIRLDASITSYRSKKEINIYDV